MKQSRPSVYALYQELLSFTADVLAVNHLDFSAYFSDAENKWFDADGIQIKIATSLLWDMLHTADVAIVNKNMDANLRFAHAETVSPLATLLEIEGTSTVSKSVLDYQSVWQADKIIPMGANIQWIFYKNNQADKPVLVKVLLIEREVHLPVKTDGYPYYHWDDVKQFYTNKLNKL